MENLTSFSWLSWVNDYFLSVYAEGDDLVYLLIVMLLRIVSIEGELYSGRVRKVSFPTPEWIVWVLPGHINLMTLLSPWKIAYLPESGELTSLEEFMERAVKLDVKGGFALVEDNVITIAAE